ncbi:hypothetical protein SAMN05444395_102157 [Flavobacterium fryxellicola]|nr:hypothetical protein SAMN05444395_102157 [Flavobacterium fryxellicola]
MGLLKEISFTRNWNRNLNAIVNTLKKDFKTAVILA